MNLFRAIAVGLHVWLVGCRQFKLIDNPGSINVYGGPILLLVIQVFYLLPLIVWLDGQRSIASPWQTKKKTASTSPEEALSRMGSAIPLDSLRDRNGAVDIVHVDRVSKSFKGKARS